MTSRRKQLPEFHSGEFIGEYVMVLTKHSREMTIDNISSCVSYRFNLHALTNKELAQAKFTSDEDWKLTMIRAEIDDCNRDINEADEICRAGKFIKSKKHLKYPVDDVVDDLYGRLISMQ